MRSYNQEQKIRTISQRLTVAFKTLRKKGYFARKNFMCCQGCGWAAVPDDKANKVVFYHKQDNDDLQKRGQVHLAWAGDAEEIVSVLESAGLQVAEPETIDGKFNKNVRIKVIGTNDVSMRMFTTEASDVVQVMPKFTSAVRVECSNSLIASAPVEETKPSALTEDMLVYLDELRESGITNMFGASPYVAEAFGLDKKDASAVLSYWMKTFAKRHKE